MATKQNTKQNEQKHEHHKGFALRIAKLPSFARLAASVVIAVVVGLLLPSSMKTFVRLVASWDVFALTSLSLIWLTIFRLEPQHIRHVARLEDPSRALALVLVLFGAGASMLAVVVLLQSTGSMERNVKAVAISIAIAAVALSWLLIHTVFTLRYAHIFHGTGESTSSAGATNKKTTTKGDTAQQSDDEAAGGLDFPDDAECPEYLDFAYFAFTIGMTAQTADIAVTSQKMRRNVLVHGILSFGFNTAVVALSIGVLTSLL